MTGSSILKEVFANVLATRIVTGVYHSVKLQNKQGVTKPVAPINGIFEGVGPDDTKGFTAYCRQTGPADVDKFERIGGCNSKLYTFSVPHKIVFFCDEEKRDHDSLFAKLTAAVMNTKKVRIQRLMSIPEDILRTEAPNGRFDFREYTFYAAIDFLLLLDIAEDKCGEEITCEGTPNPFC